MADTMPPPADHDTPAPLGDVSWNPASMPEDYSESPSKQSQSQNEGGMFPNEHGENDGMEQNFSTLLQQSDAQFSETEQVATVSQPSIAVETPKPPYEMKSQDLKRGEDETASEDVPSLQDPFNREDIVGRTNSFPPIINNTDSSGNDLPSNQVEDETNIETQQPQNTTSSGPPTASNQPDTDSWDRDDESGFFDQLKTQTKPIYEMPPEAESRFEEGIPLVAEINLDSQPQPTLEPTTTSDQHLEKLFEGGDEGEDGDDFFKTAGSETAANRGKPTITRKSTHEVISTLNPDAVDSPVEEASTEAKLGETVIKEDEEDLAARWQAELDDDDDLLLEDDVSKDTAETQTVHTSVEPSVAPAVEPARPQTTPNQPTIPTNPYAPHQPSSSELMQGIPNLYAPASTLSAISSATPFATPQTQPQPSAKAQSFAAQPREGYQSPYDLPETLARPRRPASRKVVPPPNGIPNPAPPPRSSSIPAPVRTPSTMASSLPDLNQTQSPSKGGPPTKNFFEELPAPPPRARPGSRSGRYTPQPAPALNAPAQSMAPPPVPPVPSTQHVAENAYQAQLQPPERMDPYANLSVPAVPGGPGTGRYSPKPPGATAGKPSVSPRYSPAPPSQAARPRYASQPVNLPFQPRTSSPLAHHEKNAYEAQQSHERPSTSPGPTSAPNSIAQLSSQQPPSVPAQLAHSAPYSTSEPNISQPYSPPKNPFAHVAAVNAPSQPSSNEPPYLPGAGTSQPNISSPPNEIQFAPPRRSQTQSPGRQASGPIVSQTSIEVYPRPASVHAPSSPTKINPYTVTQVVRSSRQNPDLPFVEPTDGQELDPLQRWRGAPIFKFGFAGVVSSCFPQHIPRYSAGQMTPMIKPAPGEPRIRRFKDIVPVAGDIVRYPGPLKSKSKKKEVVAWLSSRIAALENEGVPFSLQSEPDGYKKHDEKILLWKLIKLLVENDGSLDKSADIRKSVQGIISPGLELPGSDTSFDAGAGSGLYQPNDASIHAEAVDSNTLQSIKKNLLVGDREKAVWQAVDSRLWGHAMIISSTLDKALWKQVVQEFVKREVRSAGDNTESLAALYAILSGNLDESIDELVPPSARLGLQMISKGGQESTKNALDGLDRWRETLGLVLNNRSTDDYRALLSMGQLLASYNRTEASHICYLFAKAFSQNAVFGGFDDPQAKVVLLGTDHRIHPTTFFRDEDAIALTEVYEFATCTLAGNQAAALPYLQPFKLHHAYALAEQGFRNDAQQYCEVIGTIIKSNTKPSPYFNQRLFAEIDELANRLRQAPSDGGSSWMSKPSMEKVSGSMWAKFSSFVAGDESDGASNSSAMDADVGPFAKITGTPTISRSPSVSDLYGSYPVPQAASNSASRYAPGNQYAPASSPEQLRGRSSMDSQRSPSLGGNAPQRRGSQEPATPIDSGSHIPASSNVYGSPSSYPYHSTPPQSSYMPLAPVDENQASPPQQPFPTGAQQSALTSGLQAASVTFGQPIEELKNAAAEVPHYGGYEPPTASSYEPPSYQPEPSTTTDNAEDEAEEENKPKKKSYFDDDDDEDLVARAASLKISEKARRDKEADDAVRRAAEADAQKPAAPKKGWFGSWWGGKKDSDSSGGPIKAKLGEENSFYYDPDLKKWVNKKDPNSANPTARATPPPPKGPMPQSRSASAGSATSVPPTLQRPPSMSELGTSMDSRPSTGSGAPPLAGSPGSVASLGVPVLGGPNGLPRASSTGPAPTPPGSSSGLAPPTRPSTSLSTASSIDDLLGAPQARKGGTLKSKKKGRGYVDVMAK